MRGRVLGTALATSALIGASFTGAGLPAHAADGKCVITGVSPSAINVGLSTVGRDFSVRTTGCTQSWWAIDLDGEEVMGGDSGYTGLEFNRTNLTNDSAGWYEVTAHVENADGVKTSKTFEGFKITRRTGWESFNASSEPVRKGSSITIKGKLVRANWDTESYRAYTGRSVRVEFKPSGSTTWSYVKGATTSSTGWVSTKVTAGKDGTWRLRYTGSDISGAATSSSDYVDVK